MASPTVQSGVYRFFTKPQLDAERVRFTGQESAGGPQIAGASVNGQSFTFAVNGTQLSREEWGDALAAAYNQLGIYDYGSPTSSTRVVAFN